MKTVKKLTALTAFVLSLSMLLTGCTSNATSEKKKAKKEELALIGTKAKGKYVYKLEAKNESGKNITSFTIYDSGTNTTTANLLKANDAYKNNEKRELYYDAAQAIKKASANSDKELNPDYAINIIFDDQSTAVLHNIPFDDMKDMQIKYDQKNTLYYITYNSKNNKETQSTDQAEVSLKEEAAAKAKAEAEAKAKAEAEAKAKAEAEAKAKAEAEAKAKAEAAARAKAVQKAKEEAAAKAKAAAQAKAKAQAQAQANARKKTTKTTQPKASSGESSGGCVDDGEMY